MKLDYILSLLTPFGTAFLLHKPAASIAFSFHPPPPLSAFRLTNAPRILRPQFLKGKLWGNRHKLSRKCRLCNLKQYKEKKPRKVIRVIIVRQAASWLFMYGWKLPSQETWNSESNLNLVIFLYMLGWLNNRCTRWISIFKIRLIPTVTAQGSLIHSINWAQ